MSAGLRPEAGAIRKGLRQQHAGGSAPVSVEKLGQKNLAAEQSSGFVLVLTIHPGRRPDSADWDHYVTRGVSMGIYQHQADHYHDRPASVGHQAGVASPCSGPQRSLYRSVHHKQKLRCGRYDQHVPLMVVLFCDINSSRKEFR
jgi:hypothetical protein